MKYLITNPAGIQTTVESEKSLAHLSMDYSLSMDIQPISEDTPVEEVVKKPAKVKAK